MKKKIIFCGLMAILLLISTINVSSYHKEEVKATFTTESEIVLKQPYTISKDLGDLQFMWDVEEQTGDFQTVGCGCSDTHFYVTGGNNGTDPNKVYIFDFDGNYIDSFDQSGTTEWGWIDLAWDGEYFYGGPYLGERIDIFNEEGTIIDSITNLPQGVTTAVGLAYDSDTDHLWLTDKFTDKVFYEIDMDGNIINSYSNSYLVYGLAWDEVSPGGPFLWCAAQEGAGCIFYQFNPGEGDYTGVSFEAENPGSTDNKACGLGFTTAWNETAGILFAIQQCDQLPSGVGDQLAGYTVCEIGGPVAAICCDGTLNWVDVKPNSTVSGSFQIRNCGEEGSLLDWQFNSAPTWGIWEIIPDSGQDLAEGDSVTIEVSVVAPPDEKTEFSGKIKMVNTNDPTDFCEIEVSLTTPITKAFNFNQNILNWMFQQFTDIFSLLKYILGL